MAASPLGQQGRQGTCGAPVMAPVYQSHPTRGFVERPHGTSVARGSKGASNNLLIPTRLVLVCYCCCSPSVSVVHFPPAFASVDTELFFLVLFETGSDLDSREAAY